MLNELIYFAKRPYHLLKTGLINGLRAEITNNFPAKKLHIAVITGTDGKTTSSTLLYHVLKEAGIKVGLLSTVAAYIGEEEIDTGFHVTSPQPSDLHQFMRRMVDRGLTHIVMEVTSHGSYQYRAWGIKPQLAGLTNIAHEHLDYHVTYKNYLAAKTEILKKAPAVVLNEDDASYLKVRKKLGFDHTIATYSAEMPLPPIVKKAIAAQFPEAYNKLNARLVYVLAKQIGVKDSDFAKAIDSFPGIPGRMEKIPTKKRLNLIVDFAHTPQALEAALTTLQKNNQNGGKIIAVFGCAGLRDQTKRPKMGKIAAQLADYAVFTAEDPRTEDVWSIIRQMKEQLETGHDKIHSIADRHEAIEFAINTLAKPGDTVVVLGKGHEQSMCFGTTEYPWSDKEAIISILNKN